MNKRAMGVLTLVVVFAVLLVSGFSVVNAAGERVRDGSRCFITEEGVLDPLEQRVRLGQTMRDRLRDGTGNDGYCQYEETGERLFLNRDNPKKERGLRDGTGNDGYCQYEETGERLFLNRDNPKKERGLRDGTGCDGECQYEETGVRQFLHRGHGGGRGRNR